MFVHKHFDKICCVILALTLVLTFLFVNAEHFGIQKASSVMEYEKTLFDTSKVHTIDIIMEDWDDFTAECKSETYYNCTVVIDNEAYKNVAIRGKGNTSLSQVNNDRYSYKIEFDHYDNANTYHGLDKLCLNNIIQDNTYMKDYLCYQMMNAMGDATSLVNYSVDSPVSGGNVSDRLMLAWIFNDEVYTEQYHNYFSEFITSYFDSGYFSEMIDQLHEMLVSYVEKDPTKFCTYEEFEKGVETLKEFCLLRAESVRGQLEGTIGATDTFIEAGDLQIKDMGSMGICVGILAFGLLFAFRYQR